MVIKVLMMCASARFITVRDERAQHKLRDFLSTTTFRLGREKKSTKAVRIWEMTSLSQHFIESKTDVISYKGHNSWTCRRRRNPTNRRLKHLAALRHVSFRKWVKWRQRRTKRWRLPTAAASPTTWPIHPRAPTRRRRWSRWTSAVTATWLIQQHWSIAMIAPSGFAMAREPTSQVRTYALVYFHFQLSKRFLKFFNGWWKRRKKPILRQKIKLKDFSQFTVLQNSAKCQGFEKSSYKCCKKA